VEKLLVDMASQRCHVGFVVAQEMRTDDARRIDAIEPKYNCDATRESKGTKPLFAEEPDALGQKWRVMEDGLSLSGQGMACSDCE
jgi:hypothetical protein